MKIEIGRRSTADAALIRQLEVQVEQQRIMLEEQAVKLRALDEERIARRKMADFERAELDRQAAMQKRMMDDLKTMGRVGRVDGIPFEDALDAQMMAYAQKRAMGSGDQGVVERSVILEEMGLPPDKNDLRMKTVLADIANGKGLGAIKAESDRAAAEAELAEERERIAETRRFFG